MHVGFHQYIGMELKPISIFIVSQEFEVFEEIFLFPKDLLSLIATHNHVVESTLKLYPRFPIDGIKQQQTTLNVNI